LPILQLVKPDGSVETLTEAFSALAGDDLFSNRAKMVSLQFAMNLAEVGDKLVLVGPANFTAGTDTFILEDGKFIPYERRLSDSLLANLTTVGYKGRIYAMGYAQTEEKRVAFRSSQMVELEDDPEEQEENEASGSVIPSAPKSGEGNGANLVQNGGASAGIVSFAIIAVASLVYCVKRGLTRA
ncbi:hypothetical protein IJG78_00805, partial [Candidatus Saccharibacteria bacterium]|nr:hypothetical protein [Candidatus Saccharibacteria bacterium]